MYTYSLQKEKEDPCCKIERIIHALDLTATDRALMEEVGRTVIVTGEDSEDKFLDQAERETQNPREHYSQLSEETVVPETQEPSTPICSASTRVVSSATHEEACMGFDTPIQSVVSPVRRTRGSISPSNSQTLADFSRRALKELQPPILPVTEVQFGRRGRRKQVEATPSRKSSRIAMQQLNGLSAEQHAQLLLAKRAGLQAKDVPTWKDAMAKLKQMTEKELSREEIIKLANLFKIIVPEVYNPGDEKLVVEAL